MLRALALAGSCALLSPAFAAQERGPETSAFAYASPPDEAGEVVERVHVDDLAFESVRFANGVALDVKRTASQPRRILATVLLGEGRLSLAPEDSALALVAERIFELGGLEAHGYDELQRILAGHEASMTFDVQEDAFRIRGATTAEDLLLQCEVVCAYLRAPGWREDGLAAFRRQIPDEYETLRHRLESPFPDFVAALFQGDARFVYPSQRVLESVELARVRDWLAPSLREAPIEVTIVGDLDVEAAIRAVARTYGLLPSRRGLLRYDDRRRVSAPLSGLQRVDTVETELTKSVVTLAFPIPDATDIEDQRRFACLTRIVGERLQAAVRERPGATYAPTATRQQSRVQQGNGLLLLRVLSEPSVVEFSREACLSVTDALAQGGVTEPEIASYRASVQGMRRDLRLDDRWWSTALCEAHRRPASLDELRSEDRSLEGLDAARLSELARTYLARERASSLVVNPVAKATAPIRK